MDLRMIERSGAETEERRVRRDYSYRNIGERKRESELERDVHGDTEDESGTLINTHYGPISAHCFSRWFFVLQGPLR